MNISKMTPDQFIKAAINDAKARNWLAMAALQLEGVKTINPKAVMDGVMKVAATLSNEAPPEPSRLASVCRDERERESLPYAHRNLNLPPIEEPASSADLEAHEDQMFTTDDRDRGRMAMIEF
jgi:hypothetical protein